MSLCRTYSRYYTQFLYNFEECNFDYTMHVLYVLGHDWLPTWYSLSGFLIWMRLHHMGCKFCLNRYMRYTRQRFELLGIQMPISSILQGTIFSHFQISDIIMYHFWDWYKVVLSIFFKYDEYKMSKLYSEPNWETNQNNSFCTTKRLTHNPVLNIGNSIHISYSEQLFTKTLERKLICYFATSSKTCIYRKLFQNNIQSMLP